MKISALLGAAALVALATPAQAHFRITSHDSRHGGDDPNIKSAPCGVAASERGANVYTVEAGSTLMLVFEEYIDHPGWYRVALDLDGDDDFVDPATATDYEAGGMFPDGTVLVTDIPDMVTPQGQTTTYMQAVEIPEGIECDNCTLQAIQVMTEDPDNPTMYYDCIDLVITNPAVGVPDAGPGGGGEDPGGQDPLDPMDPSVSGGCSSAGGAGGGALALLALAAFGWRRRRA